MNYLLDTHVFIWMDSEPDKLSSKAVDIVPDREHTLYLSLASVWEIQIKYQTGKLKRTRPLMTILNEQRRINQIVLLPVTLPHILALENLPNLHRDPFDRILVAQTQVEGFTLLSHDQLVRQYPVNVVW